MERAQLLHSFTIDLENLSQMETYVILMIRHGGYFSHRNKRERATLKIYNVIKATNKTAAIGHSIL
jgi:hypothetical protein